jgi:hypothetical protein
MNKHSRIAITCRYGPMLVLIATLSSLSFAQRASKEFSSATAEQLIAEADRRSSSNEFNAVETAIAVRAIELVLAQGASDQLEPSKMNRLLKLAEPRLPQLNAGQRQQFAALVAKQPANKPGSSLDELQSRVILLRASGDVDGRIPQIIEEWVNARGIDSLSIDEAEWCLRESLPNKTQRKAFSVIWTGLLTAPRAGDYIFSVSPININGALGANAVRQTISVSVAGKSLIQAGPAETTIAKGQPKLPPQSAPPSNEQQWKYKAEPMDLTAGQAVSVRVEMHYQCSEPSYANSPSAILYWEGPGIDRRPVAADFLSVPDQTSNGLLAEYHVTDQRQAVTIKQNNANIEFAWVKPADMAPSNPELVMRLTQRLWTIVTDRIFIGQCASGAVKHPYLEDYSSAEYLSCAQRKQFLQLVQDTPGLLSRVDDQQLLRLYRQFRFGDADRALDTVGHWMQTHADIAPRITDQFYRDNRQVYAELAEQLTRQLPEQYRLLQSRYLEMPDGRCALPVAYTLSYSYRALDQVASMSALEAPPLKKPARRQPGDKPPVPPKPPEPPSAGWVKVLTNKIDDKSLSETAHANWLLARAQAAEAAAPAAMSAGSPRENYLAGLNWLTEAHLSTKDPNIQSRIYLEEVARLAAMNQMKKANETLSAAGQVVSAEEIQSWRRDVEVIAALRMAAQVAAKEAGRNGYISAIQRRKASAVARNDKAAVDRYEGVLQAMHVDSK